VPRAMAGMEAPARKSKPGYAGELAEHATNPTAASSASQHLTQAGSHPSERGHLRFGVAELSPLLAGVLQLLGGRIVILLGGIDRRPGDSRTHFLKMQKLRLVLLQGPDELSDLPVSLLSVALEGGGHYLEGRLRALSCRTKQISRVGDRFGQIVGEPAADRSHTTADLRAGAGVALAADRGNARAEATAPAKA
jgi:hypothetical protein